MENTTKNNILSAVTVTGKNHMKSAPTTHVTSKLIKSNKQIMDKAASIWRDNQKVTHTSSGISNQTIGKDTKSTITDQKTQDGSISQGVGWKALGAATDMISGMIGDSGKNTAFTQQQQLGSALMAINPMVGGIYKAASIVGELTGTNVSMMNQDQAKAAGISGGARIANNVAAFIPGVGLAGKTIDANKSHVIDSMAGGFGGSVSDINTSASMGGQNYLFGKKKANTFIREMNETNRLMTDINTTNTLRKSSDYGVDLAQQNLNRYAGNNYMNMHLGRHGMKFPQLDEIRLILTNRKQDETSHIEKFANGGLLEGENLMPQGQLHARLHNIHESDPDLAAKLTRKGIPVVALTEDGDIQQVAEIEHSEWI